MSRKRRTWLAALRRHTSAALTPGVPPLPAKLGRNVAALDPLLRHHLPALYALPAELEQKPPRLPDAPGATQEVSPPASVDSGAEVAGQPTPRYASPEVATPPTRSDLALPGDRRQLELPGHPNPTPGSPCPACAGTGCLCGEAELPNAEVADHECDLPCAACGGVPTLHSDARPGGQPAPPGLPGHSPPGGDHERPTPPPGNPTQGPAPAAPAPDLDPGPPARPAPGSASGAPLPAEQASEDEGELGDPAAAPGARPRSPGADLRDAAGLLLSRVLPCPPSAGRGPRSPSTGASRPAPAGRRQQTREPWYARHAAEDKAKRAAARVALGCTCPPGPGRPRASCPALEAHRAAGLARRGVAPPEEAADPTPPAPPAPSSASS